MDKLVVGGTLGLLVFLVAAIILWIFVSLPVYFASKIVKGGKSTLVGAMIATLVGPIVFYVVYILVAFALGAIGANALALAGAFILAFLAWIGVYRAVFNTGWIGAFGIAILAAIIYLVLDVLVFSVFHVSFPGSRFLPLHFFALAPVV